MREFKLREKVRFNNKNAVVIGREELTYDGEIYEMLKIEYDDGDIQSVSIEYVEKLNEDTI